MTFILIMLFAACFEEKKSDSAAKSSESAKDTAEASDSGQSDTAVSE